MSESVLSNDNLLVSSNLMTRHCLGVASTGGGKTNFLNLLLKQQMMRGGGAIHIDGKNSKEAMLEFLNLARQHNRWHDVRILNPGDGELSNTYNPLVRGDADELTSRVVQLISMQGDALSRSHTARGARAIFGVLKAMGLPFNFGDLNAIMTEGPAMQWILDNGPKETKEYQDYKAFVGQILSADEKGNPVVDEGKMREIFGDLASRLHSYYVGSASRVMNSYNPDVDIYEAIRENQLIYVALPMLSKAELAIDFARFLVSDLRTAVGQLQNDNYKPSPTFMVLMDEFSSYAMPSLGPLFEQARSANVSLFPFIQTISSLKDSANGLNDDFASKIIGNTWNKIAFVLRDPESCEVMSTLAGQTLQESVSESYGESLAFSDDGDDSSMLRTGGRGRSYGKSVSVGYGNIVRGEDFKNLEDGEAIFIGRQEVLKLQVPLLTMSNENKDLDFPRFRLPQKKGLSLAQKYLNVKGV